MIGAFTTHAWLLLTLRHNGHGISRNPSATTLLFTVLIAISASWIRWDKSLVEAAFGMTLLFFLITYICNLRVAVGYMILSAAIDVLAVATAGIGQSSSAETMYVFAAWETIGFFSLIHRDGINDKTT